MHNFVISFISTLRNKPSWHPVDQPVGNVPEDCLATHQESLSGLSEILPLDQHFSAPQHTRLGHPCECVAVVLLSIPEVATVVGQRSFSGPPNCVSHPVTANNTGSHD